MKMTESTLLANYIHECKGKGLPVQLTDAIEFIQTVIAGTTDYLSQVKSKNEKTALLFSNIKGDMVVAAVVEYVDGEDGNPGSWYYSYTFNKDDTKDCKVYDIYSAGPKQIIANRGVGDYRLRVKSPEYISQLGTLFFEILYDFLDQNAVEGEKFTLEHEGFFEASVEVVDGEKVMSFIPDGAIKRLIKDDDLASADVK